MSRTQRLFLFVLGGDTINELAVDRLLNYIDAYLFAPEISWDSYQFEERSYERWAAFELLERMMDHPLEDPETLVEEFVFMVDLYSRLHKDSKTSFIFTTAKETAEDILCEIKKGERNVGKVEYGKNDKKRPSCGW